MASTRQLFIEILLDIRKSIGSIGIFKGQLNLLASAFRAVFRTVIVAGFFLLIRKIFMTIQSLVGATKNLVSQFVQLQFSGQLVAAILTKGSAETAETFKQITLYAREASTQIQYTAQQIQQGLRTAAIAGFDLEESISVASSAMKLAQIAGEEFNSTINGLIGVVRAFNVEMGKIPQLADSITTAITHSKMTLNEFFTAMKYVSAASVTAFGESAATFIDTAAGLMTLSDIGLQASKSGVYLRSAMMKLMGATNKTTTAFAHYGVNIYKADAESQKYLKTLTQGQTILGGYNRKIADLKQLQFDLALSGKQSGYEFSRLADEIDKIDKKTATFKDGLSEVYKLFTLAGGKMKPLYDILSDIRSKGMPTEVIGRMFGVRSGVGIQALLGQFERFEKHRATLKQYWSESEKGASILGNIFAKMLDTVLVKWARVKNTALGIFWAIGETALDALSPVLDIILEGMQKIFKWVEANKGTFGAMFKEAAEYLKPLVKDFFEKLPELIKRFKDAVTGGVSVPIFGYDADSGKVGQTGTKASTGSLGKRLSTVFESIFSLIGSYFQKMIKDNAELLKGAGQTIATGMTEYLKANIEVFAGIGIQIAKGMFIAVKQMFMNWISQPQNIIKVGYTAGGAIAGSMIGRPYAGAAAGAMQGQFASEHPTATAMAGGIVPLAQSWVGILDIFNRIFDKNNVSSENINKSAADLSASTDNIQSSTTSLMSSTGKLLDVAVSNKAKIDALSRKVIAISTGVRG